MKMLVGVASFLVGFALTDGTARAHHSHSMFDTSQEMTITGTVTSFSYRNPHVFLYLDVKDEKGEVAPWAVEMSNISNMETRGIFRSYVQGGRRRDGQAQPAEGWAVGRQLHLGDGRRRKDLRVT